MPKPSEILPCRPQLSQSSSFGGDPGENIGVKKREEARFRGRGLKESRGCGAR